MKERIRQRAAELGFDDCRFATAAPPETAAALQRWLAAGQHGEMAWLARNAYKRLDPQQVLPGAGTAILVAVSYGEVQDPPVDACVGSGGPPSLAPYSVCRGPHPAFVARYARHADYHDVLGARLKELSAFLNDLGGSQVRSLWYVDTGPILEREFAQRAGVGFVGKHTNVISRRFGNWILLGEILTTLELEPDVPEKNRCGSCARCLEACPTQAIELGHEHQLSFTDRADSIFIKDMLIDPVPAGGHDTPQKVASGSFNRSIPDQPNPD